MQENDLESRFVEFIFTIRNISVKLKNDDFSLSVTNQMSRSSLSSSLNYGEARSAQSTRDFIHKLSIVLKELRETKMNLKVIDKLGLCKEKDLLSPAIKENDELIAIIYKSISTAKRRLK